MRYSRAGTRGVLLAVPLGLALLCGGCYEGWDQPIYGGNQAPPSPPTPPPATLFGYILFQPIFMAPDAINDGTCFPKTDIRQFKQDEWAERVAAISAAIAPLADTVVTHPVAISAGDCAQVSAVLAEAAKLTPWAPDASPENDTSGKKSVHLTAAFWEGEPEATPAAAVTGANWAAWAALIAEGRAAISLRYFVISNPVNGYYSQWQSALTPAETLAGTPINDVNPTVGGQTARDALVASDTTAMVTWLEGNAP